jgi:hypothetical protein
MVKATRKAPSVTSSILFFSFISIYLSCSTYDNISKIDNNDEYEVIQSKSKMVGSYIAMNFYDFENKNIRIPAAVDINGVILQSSKSSNLNLQVSSKKQKFNIKILFIGKKNVEIRNLIINKRDSLIVNVYLKDSDNILY